MTIILQFQIQAHHENRLQNYKFHRKQQSISKDEGENMLSSKLI